MSDYASESGHYYTREGEPAYTVMGKNGKERNTTIRDARKFGLVPSVTEIMKLYPKPFLELWKAKQVLMSALTLYRVPFECDRDFTARITEDAKAQSKKAAEKGTEIHAAVEKAFQGKPVPPEYTAHVRKAVSALVELIQEDNLFTYCSSEKSFAHPLGFGGKVDLHSDKLNFVCDFKTKEFDDPDKVEPYDDNKIQLIAYRKGLGMPENTRLMNCYISTSVPGLVKLCVHDPKDEPHFWGVFQSLHCLWKKIKKYDC